MTKLQFLISLNERLTDLPREEVEERLRFYTEMIEDRMEDGLSEEEAVAAVGSAEEIAVHIREELRPQPLFPAQPAPKKRRSTGEILLLILGAPLWVPLLAAAVVVALSVYITWWAILISLWAIDASLVCCSLGGLLAGLFLGIRGSVSAGLALLGAGIFCAGLAVLLFFVCKALTAGTAVLTKKLIKRRKSHV